MDKSDKTWDFSEQIKVGNKGEKLLLKKWATPIRKLGGKGPDFLDTDGRLIELKTDTYELEKTPNLFLERWSSAPRDGQPGRAGGPWQALDKGATTFVYLFINAKTWFIFDDLAALVTRLDALTEKAYVVNIRNRGYLTQGYRVKRKDLADLYREEKL